MHPFATHFLEHAHRHLPGRPAQQLMAPRLADGSFRSFDVPEDARKNAVLLVLHEGDQHPSMLLTLRSSALPTHKGQWSFPGGRMESGESIVDAALRETEEEVGIGSHSLQVLGHLTSLYTPPSHSIIHPVVAWWNGTGGLACNAGEVELTLHVPLSEVFLEKSVEEEWDYKGSRMIVPQWKLPHQTPLWGATAIIVSEFISMYSSWLKESSPSSAPHFSLPQL